MLLQATLVGGSRKALRIVEDRDPRTGARKLSRGALSFVQERLDLHKPKKLFATMRVDRHPMTPGKVALNEIRRNAKALCHSWSRPRALTVGRVQ